MIEENIIVGPSFEHFTDSSLGELLLPLLKTHGTVTLQIDAVSGQKQTGNLLLDRAIHLAKWLKSRNIGVGDSISVNSENRLEFCVVPVAGFLIGATFAPLNPDYTPGELKHVLNLSKPKFVFCSSKTIEKMTKILPSHPYIENLILFDKHSIKHKKITFYEAIIKGATGKGIDETFTAMSVNPKETIATILCSSGTTGLPKGVMCTHDNMTCFIDIMRHIMAEILNSEEPNETVIGLAPFFHSMGFMVMFLNILRGKTTIILNKFSLKLFLDTIQKYKIRILTVPPPVLLALMKSPLTKNYDLSCIKEIRCGAAPMGKDLEKDLNVKLRVGHISQNYGMTETTLATLASPFGKTKLGSVGTIVPGMMVKVIDKDGKALGSFQEGELCFKGPLIMRGYIGDPEATSLTIDSNGWLHTGDVAYYDDEKYFFIVDRIKELIKYKGFQVAPAELEALLITNPAIADAAVIGLPNEDAGELPLAFVVRKNNGISEGDIEKFVADNVSPQKKLRGGVIFVDFIPRNPTGKILRRLLKQQAIQIKSKL